jgi:RNA polymerase sigma-70 factor (ECF subfamily)
VDDSSRLRRFEDLVLAHLDAAYNLARWLTGDAATAEDAIQEASLRAFRFFDQMEGPRPKAWFMAIVRNACLDALRERRLRSNEEAYDEDVHSTLDAARNAYESPESALERQDDAREVHARLAALPVEYREVVVLRELEGLSYKEIALVVGVPIGTVMSRLARGRDLLQRTALGGRGRERA